MISVLGGSPVLDLSYADALTKAMQTVMDPLRKRLRKRMCEPDIFVLPKIFSPSILGQMQFTQSDIVNPRSYRTHGLCRGIDLRLHNDRMGEKRGAIRCQKDWSRLVAPLKGYKGTLGNPYSFIEVTIPEALPERLEILSYANEFAFLYDGAMTLTGSLSPGSKDLRSNMSQISSWRIWIEIS